MRNTNYTCIMKSELKRYSRSYKATDSVYKNAMRRAKKEKGKLANIVENVVTAYAYGLDIKAVKIQSGEGHAIDIFTEDFSIKLNKLKKS